MIGKAVEQLWSSGVAEDGRPFGKGQVGGDDDRGLLVQPADETEQEPAAGLCERQVAELVEDQEVEPGQLIGDATLAASTSFGFEAIDEGRRRYGSGRGRRRECSCGLWPPQDGVFPLPVPPTNTALR